MESVSSANFKTGRRFTYKFLRLFGRTRGASGERVDKVCLEAGREATGPQCAGGAIRFLLTAPIFSLEGSQKSGTCSKEAATF